MQDGRTVVWTTTQGPFVVRDGSAAILGIDAAMIKVIPTEIGGGFGGKITLYLEPLALVLSRKANRPVKMVMTRDEVFRATGPTSGTKVRVKIGAKSDGTLVAATASLWYEGGAGRRDVLPGVLPHSQLLDRSERRRRQQAEGRGVSRARLADGGVRD